ncbi:MAG: hypothetical protein ABIK93_02980 [candidate division WOR-3 bacterium]
MHYQVNFNTSEWEIIAETFNFDKYYQGEYDSIEKLRLTREAWQGNLPLYLHDIQMFKPEVLIERAKGIVTTDPVFAVFDKTNLTFAEMIWEIWARRKEIIKISPGDYNYYE